MSQRNEPDCIFCRIATGAVPSDVVLQTPTVTAFRDLSPQAPVHVLVVPNAHVADLSDVDAATAAALLAACLAVAQAEGVSSSGYRVVTNIGRDGGQSVGHLHFHVLGGRPLAWPPG